MNTLRNLLCVLVILCCGLSGRIEAQGTAPIQALGGSIPWQFGAIWTFNSSSPASLGFDVRAISVYTIRYIPVGTITTCSLSIDSGASIDPTLGTLVSPTIGGIVAARNIDCSAPGTWDTSGAIWGGTAAYARVTPTITGSGSVIVVILGYTEAPWQH